MPGQHTGPLLGLTFGFDPKSNDWGPFYNADLREIEGLLMLSVITIGDNAPPGSPSSGDRYVVGGTPTGLWAGHAGEIAFFEGSTWVFYTPREGWIAWESTADTLKVYNGTTWGSSTDHEHLSGYDEQTGTSTTSATLEDITGLTFDLVLPSSGRILAILTVECETSGGGGATVGAWAVKIDASDGTEIKRALSGTLDTGSMAVQNRSGVLSAGTYTVKGRHRRVSGASVIETVTAQLSAVFIPE